MENNLLTLRNGISVATHKLLKHYDIGFIFDNLDSLILLDIPFREARHSTEQYQHNHKIAMAIFKKANDAYEKLLEELQSREQLFAQIRKTNPNFCSSMQGKVEEEEYEEYVSLLRNLNYSIRSLISAFPRKNPQDFSYSHDYNNNYDDLKLQKEDAVSSIIDSKDSSRMSFLEDSFVLSELNDLNLSTLDSDTIKKITLLKNSLQERIRKYKIFDELYRHGNGNRKQKTRQDDFEI